MQKLIIKKNIYYLLILAIIILTISFYFQKTTTIKASSVVTPPTVIEVTSLPKKLMIPKINVSAEIEHVGTTKDGDMGIPKVSKNVAWYKLGAIPGAKGNAVIAGHLDNYLGLPLVFWKLDELEIGDDIFVITEDGTEVNFKVTEKKLYDYNSLETADIFGPTNERHLNLITCNGTWFQDIRNYNKRLVIFSKAV